MVAFKVHTTYGTKLMDPRKHAAQDFSPTICNRCNKDAELVSYLWNGREFHVCAECKLALQEVCVDTRID